MRVKFSVAEYWNDADGMPEHIRTGLESLGCEPNKYTWTEYEGDIDEVLKLGFRVTVSPDKVSGNVMLDIRRSLLKLEERIVAISSNESTLNQRCSVHIPGFELLGINEVCVHSNCCTHFINDQLGEGWKILAICVQPDQRRPDYILGRTVREH